MTMRDAPRKTPRWRTEGFAIPGDLFRSGNARLARLRACCSLGGLQGSCLIAALSPKASATLARRCLQWMIRDFSGLTAGRLVDEIEAIKTNVDGDAWSAIEG